LGVGCGGEDGASNGGSGGSAAGSGGISGGGAAGDDAGLGGTAGTGAAGSGGTLGDAGSDAPVGPPPYDTKAAERKGCAFGPGDKTTATVGPDVPHGDAMPFKHVIVLMMENRSFDHYFSQLPAYGVTDVDVATDQDYNIDPDVTPAQQIHRYHETRYCIVDPNHEWTPVHLQYDNGAMDGFVATNNPGGGRAMGYHDQTDIPYYYWLAKNFAISDRHFCSLLGPTWPNRFYLYGATSWGNTKTSDGTIFINQKHITAPKIMDVLDDAGRSWKIYRDHLSFASIFKPTDPDYYGSSMATFDSDVDANTLPDVAFVDPTLFGTGGGPSNDEHPPANLQRGQQFTARVLNKLMSNPTVWNDTVFFLVYDEHGGYYDHVPPPEACEPDNDVPPDFPFDRLGMRTPLIVASPWVRPGYVSHIVTDITSITRFIENRFDLPAMTNRDANAWPMLDMFDFSQPALATPPSGAPSATLDPAGVQYCTANPNGGTGLP
jgi:phospholipase C